MNKNPTVRVGVIWKESKGQYFLKWKDPISGKYSTRKTSLCERNQKNERAASKLGSKLEAELNAMFRKPETGVSWEQFQAIYKEQRLPFTSKDNQTKWRCAAAVFDRVWPDHVYGVLMLNEVTPRLLLAVESEMRKTLSQGSVLSYSATLRAGFSYAAKLGLMPMLPARPPDNVEQQLPAMRLSPIAMESLERMEQAAEKVVGKVHSKGIAQYMRCLWLSGCRLIDPLWMHPYKLDCHHPIVLDGQRPMFGWVARQKNKRDQIARITLDFAAWIKPLCEGCDGWIFNPTCEHGRIESKHQLSSLIAEIGEKAKVVAEPSLQKTATAKHFRSSFVTRWSRRGMPIEQISAMVRHATIETTRKYYLAPADPDLLRTFSESVWIGDQFGDQPASPSAKTT
jgi:integrase